MVGATINQEGLLHIRANRIGKDTFLSHIIRLVEEAQKLNPGANLKRLKGGEEINLPASAFTVREKEWLQGSGIIPKEYFGQGTGLNAIAQVLFLVATVAAATFVINRRSV